MALNNCKECKKEVSTNAKTCPYCGINNPGVIDSNRRIGIVVLVVMICLGIFAFTKHERADYHQSEKVEISENKVAAVAKVKQVVNSRQSLSAHSLLMETVAEEASKIPEQSVLETLPKLPVIQELPKQATLEQQDNAENIYSADTSQTMVMHMLEYALNADGLSHESVLQETKLQIENLAKPEKGNKKAARVINLKGLAALKEGDFNKAVELFEKANKLDASDVEIINNLGFSYLKKGDFNAAQQVIISALTLSPGRTTAWENLGEVFGKKGEVNKALACFSNAYRFSKDRLTLHQYMKGRNQKEDDKRLKQAREKAINWAEKIYLNGSKNIQQQESVRHDLAASKK
ncbi:tetratricopeptide repeat protein [Methylobacter psychrophilus]|uniref:tetratricopeptide repeat protein n=1 Tax=Methylobacter psychrophilus TaxID=96941 RepID=UPI0021D48EBA|nr:tetratricopeptide repeat protein [Methylobacter psychrophilus]